MINVQTCYTVSCDGCKQEFEHDFTPHWPTPKEARSETDGCEWVSDGTQDFCPDCATNPHPFRLEPNTTDHCWHPENGMGVDWWCCECAAMTDGMPPDGCRWCRAAREPILT